MGSTDSNTIAIITNKLGYDVDIYDVFNPNASTQGALQYKKLATVKNAASAQQVQTIHFASQLQAMRTGNIPALNNNYYLQFPVAVLAVSPFNDSNEFTLTSDMQQGMEDSFKFIKYTQANPSSQLATNFRTALGDKTNQKLAVNKYFQATASFQKCTLSTWTAVFSWQAQFTNPWQGTYYLYSIGDSSGSPPPALVATMAISTRAQADSAVLTMAGTNNENTSVVMGGDGTMQEANQGTGNLSVVLTPTWLNVSQTSQQDGKTVINYVIGAVFTGTINGQKVTGNLNKLSLPDPADQSKNAKDKNSANSFSLSSLAELTQKKNDVQKDAKDKTDAQKKEDSVEKSNQDNNVPKERAKADQVAKDVVPEVQAGYNKVDQAQEIQVKQGTVDNQVGELKEIIEEGAPSQATEDTAQGLMEAKTDLAKALNPATSAADRDTAMRDASTKLETTGADLGTALQTQRDTLSDEEVKALTDTKEALEEVKAQTDAADKNREEQAEKTKIDQDEDVADGKDLDNPKEEPPVEFRGEL